MFDLRGDTTSGAIHQVVASLRAQCLELGGIEGTLQLVNFRGLPPLNLRPYDGMLRGIAKEASWDVPASFGVNPITSPAALAHWRVQVVVMELLGPKKTEKFLQMAPSPVSKDPRGRVRVSLNREAPSLFLKG